MTDAVNAYKDAYKSYLEKSSNNLVPHNFKDDYWKAKRNNEKLAQKEAEAKKEKKLRMQKYMEEKALMKNIKSRKMANLLSEYSYCRRNGLSTIGVLNKVSPYDTGFSLSELMKLLM